MLQVKKESSSTLIGASISPSSTFMASVPYLADFDFLKSYNALNDVSTDFTVLDFQKDKKLTSIYFNSPDKLKSLLSKIQSIRSQSLGRQAFQDFSSVLQEDWAQEVKKQYAKSSSTLRNQLLLIKIPQNLSQQQLTLITDTIMASNIDGVIIGGNQKSNLKQNASKLIFNNNKRQKTKKAQKQERRQNNQTQKNAHNQVLYHFFQNLGKDKIIISSNNFTINGEEVLDRIRFGASIVLINEWKNPFLYGQIKSELIKLMRDRGLRSLQEVRGSIDN